MIENCIYKFLINSQRLDKIKIKYLQNFLNYNTKQKKTMLSHICTK